MYMDRKKKNMVTAFSIFAMFMLLGIAGRMDYTEEVIYHMSQSAYDEIKDTLGEGASEYEIARYYNKEYKSWEGKE